MNLKSILSTILILGAVVAGVFYLIKVNSFTDPQITFKPQQEKVYKIEASNAAPFNIVASILPKFAIDVNKEEFSNLWKADGAQKDAVYGEVIGSIRNAPLSVKTQIDEKTKQVYVTPEVDNQLKPGLYKLNVTIKTVQAKEVTITQDFTWGVLAVNTNKATYQVGEKVNIGMGVLDDYGDTKCIAKGPVQFETAKVWLTITSPSGKETNLSTDDGNIIGSKECGPKTVTNTADFQTETTADEVGKYKIHMEAENINGKRSMDDYFAVSATKQPFDIERTSYPTRIYPKKVYPVTITVKANQDYHGPITDIVPENFGISEISDGGRTIKEKDYQKIIWNADWQTGQTHILKYTIEFPPISPEFYIVGPLTIGDYSEGRNWQIASDAVFTLIQEKDATTASAQTLLATLTSTPGRGHLIVVNCYRTTGDAAGGFLSFTNGGSSMSVTSASGGYSTAESNSDTTSNTTGVAWMFYKIAGASEATGITCNKTDDTKANGPMGIQVLEFSGGSSTITQDSAAGSHSNADQTAGCNAGSFQSATNPITPTNSNSLIISAFMIRAASKTISSHTNSFIDTDISGGSNGFNNATGGSYDAGYLELAAAAAKTDTITLNAAGTGCSNVIATFNNGYIFSQGSYRFFDDSDASTPPTALGGAQDTPVTLLHRRFRVRMLLTNGSPTGTTLPMDGGKFKLQYATLPSGVCSGQSYTDVTNSSTVAFSDNSTIAAGADISAGGSDPTGGTVTLQSFYDDLNSGGTPPYISNHNNTIPTGQSGLWDFSLIDNTSVTSLPVTYCLRIIEGYTGAVLGTYNQYPQFTGVTNHVNFLGGSTTTGGTTVF